MVSLAHQATIDTRDFDAMLFDLDGVVTDTARAHAASWKKLFDGLLRERADREGEPFVPFDRERDYIEYVDGKPRQDGAKAFLKSRGIDLPEGDANDPPGVSTLTALAKRKNELFKEHLDQHGVEVFGATVRLISEARKRDMKIAIISSSRNCEMVLEVAGIADLFDAKVDGTDLETLGLKGKPDPAVFLRAAKLLGVDPARAVVVEDALSGVQAGRDGGFGMVIGVDRRGEGNDLIEHGADVVVSGMEDVVLERTANESGKTFSDQLPSAIGECRAIFESLRGCTPAVFLDYDGTLTPIVERPEDAVLSDDMREAVRRLAESCRVAVISGRDLDDVRSRVKLDNLFYAGSHGFDIAGPAGFKERHEAGTEHATLLDEVERELRAPLVRIAGTQLERKRYSIAVHYRRVDESQIGRVEEAVDSVLAKYEGLRKTHGKKVFDLQPDIDWHKGRAVEWLMDALKLDRRTSAAVYLGDCLTDEDAFRVLGASVSGVGIIITDDQPRRETSAAFALHSVKEVAQFLAMLADAIRRENS